MYTYKGTYYRVLAEVKMKHPITREWVDGILYTNKNKPELFVREKNEFYNLFKEAEKIPYHVQAIAKLYSVLKTEGNLAEGEIRKFKFVSSSKGTIAIGKQVLAMEFVNNKDYDAIWIHVGNDYFKMIGLWPSPHC